MGEGFLLGSEMCKESRCLKLAARAAEQSGHDIFRHGAVLVRGGSILNIAANSDNHTAFGQRFRIQPGRATHHAETACVLGLDKAMTQGGVIYAARVNKDGEWKMSTIEGIKPYKSNDPDSSREGATIRVLPLENIGVSGGEGIARGS